MYFHCTWLILPLRTHNLIKYNCQSSGQHQEYRAYKQEETYRYTKEVHGRYAIFQAGVILGEDDIVHGDGYTCHGDTECNQKHMIRRILPFVLIGQDTIKNCEPYTVNGEQLCYTPRNL